MKREEMLESEEEIEGIGPRNLKELEQFFKNYKYTKEEYDVLMDCYDNAFYTRGMPLAIGLSAFLQFGPRYGYLKPRTPLTSIATITIAGAFAGILGMLSATGKCKEKLSENPNSLYGRYLHHEKYGKFHYEYEPLKMRKEIESLSNEVSDHFPKPNVLNMDIERPFAMGFDDFKRFPNDDSIDMRDDDPPKPSVTYAQLRKKNRDAYAKTTDAKYDRVTSDAGESRQIIRAEPTSKVDATEPDSSAKRNKYGDI